MASEMDPEARVAALMRSMGGQENFTRIARGRQPVALEQVRSASDETVAPLAAQADLWKECSAPDVEPRDAGGESASLRLQEQFLAEHGYNWWSPPPHLVKIKGSRPPQNKATPTPAASVGADGIDLTLDPRCGEPAPRDLKFTPFAAICKFPYKFVSREWSQPLATAIFDDSKIQNRDWNLYYLNTDIDCPQPCVFVTEAQLEALVGEINECFPDADITVSQDLRDDGLVIDFSGFADENLRPRWLGHSTCRDQTDGWPARLEQTICNQETMSNTRDVELFKQKLEMAYEIGRNKRNAAKKAKQEASNAKKKAMIKGLLRAQKYLGLLPSDEENLLPDITSLSVAPLDPTQTVSNNFLEEPIFIAIDVEAFERSPNQITEVGVATLDTRVLKHVAPSTNGTGWQGAIRARHFRIAEHKHLVNTLYVEGCPEHFEFGNSEMIGRDKIGAKLTSCFHAPYSSAHVVGKDVFGPRIDTEAPTVEDGEEKRNIIFLGHDVDNDIAYLRKLGFDPLYRSNLLETMDTRSMFQTYTHDPNPTSLGRILAHFDLCGWHLHNAGNDAVYTVWALLAMAVASAAERGKPEPAQRRTEDLARREKQAVGEASERVRDVAQGWEEGEQDDLGGGVSFGRKQNAQGFVPWQGSESGFYTENGYPIDV